MNAGGNSNEKAVEGTSMGSGEGGVIKAVDKPSGGQVAKGKKKKGKK